MTYINPSMCRWPILALLLLVSGSGVHAEIKTEIIGDPQFHMNEDSAVTGVKDKEQSLYQAQLAGQFSVKFSGLENKAYKVVVGNSELAIPSKDFRIFSIEANGKKAVENLNLNERFGFAIKADVSFPAEADQGVIQIDFIVDPKHDRPRMSFVRIYDSENNLVAEETALAHKPANWSATKRVVMLLPEVIQDFPKKNPAKTFSDLKIYDALGRPWRTASEDWSRARQHVESDPAWKEWVTRQKDQVDKWMAHHPSDRTTWICGWYHDFVSPKDGSFLEWTDEIPGEEASYFRSKSDPKVAITPKIFSGWVFNYRFRHAEMMKSAALLYRLTNDPKYAIWAANQLDFYANHFTEWPKSKRGDGARLCWQTLDEATNLTKYVECARLLGDYSSGEQKTLWKNNLFYPVARMLNDTFQQIHNIATWHRSAAAQVALLYNDENLWKESIDGSFGIRRQISSGVTSDYIWWEQSFGYNYYLCEALLSLFRSATIQGHSEDLSTEMEVAENLILSLIYLRNPDGSLPTPADTTVAQSAPNIPLLISACRVFPTHLGLAYAKGKHSWEILLDSPTDISNTQPDLPEVKSSNLESTRMALLKSDSWQVFFHYGQLTSSHAQSELPNFTAYYKNLDITHDPGTVGYGSPLHKGYYGRGLCHNVPLIDGEGAYTLPQKGVLDEYSDSPAKIKVTYPEYRPGVTTSRIITLDNDTLTDLTTVKIKDGSTHKIGLSLHFQGKVSLPREFKPDPTFATNRPEPFTYWSSVQKAQFRDKAEFDISFGKTIFRLTLTIPGPFTIWQASAPDIPPDRSDAFYIEVNSASVTFSTTLSTQ